MRDSCQEKTGRPSRCGGRRVGNYQRPASRCGGRIPLAGTLKAPHCMRPLSASSVHNWRCLEGTQRLALCPGAPPPPGDLHTDHPSSRGSVRTPRRRGRCCLRPSEQGTFCHIPFLSPELSLLCVGWGQCCDPLVSGGEAVGLGGCTLKQVYRESPFLTHRDDPGWPLWGKAGTRVKRRRCPVG